MTKVRLTSSIETAKHGCPTWSAGNEEDFLSNFAGREAEVIETVKPQGNWLCGTDVVFKCRFTDRGIAHLCRHQIIAGD